MGKSQKNKPRLLKYFPPLLFMPPGSRFILNGFSKAFGYVNSHTTSDANQAKKRPEPKQKAQGDSTNVELPSTQRIGTYTPNHYVVLQTFVSSILENAVKNKRYDLESAKSIASDVGVSLSLVSLMDRIPLPQLVYSLRNLQQALLNVRADQELFVSILKFFASMGITSICYNTPIVGPALDAAANFYILQWIDAVSQTELMRNTSKRFDQTVNDVKQAGTKLIFKSNL
ncbi:hypothetical protein AKO1_005284 [Acrasis kona]|uniref:Uncharacterized protein n=1 Tax=Acrasis kona TaxID=1008807 RepID=A0AAW2YME4_9EUKA